MSNGVRVGVVTDIVIGKTGPMKCEVGGHPVQCWKVLRDFDANMDYANPAYPALIQYEATGEPLAVAGWEKLYSYQRRGRDGEKMFNPDGTAKMSDPKPVFEAQRVIQASESEFGDVFTDYVQAMGASPAPTPAPNVPPGENPARYYQTGGGGQADGEGREAPAPPTDERGWAKDPQPRDEDAGAPTTNLRSTSSSPIDWLNDSYDAPYRAARITAAWAIGRVLEMDPLTAVPPSFFAEDIDPKDRLLIRATFLANQLRALTERLVNG